MKALLKETISLGFLKIPKGECLDVLQVNESINCSSGYLAKVEYNDVIFFIDSYKLEKCKEDAHSIYDID